MPSHRFEARLVRPDTPGAWTFLKVPPEVTKALGTRARIPVRGTVGGASVVGSLMPDGDGGHYLVVAKAVREAARVDVGDAVSVVLEVDASERRVEVPAELAAALAQDAQAKASFEAFSYSHQKEYVDFITEAKKEETRQRRLQTALGMLERGEKLGITPPPKR